jgi:hypothetical protein
MYSFAPHLHVRHWNAVVAASKHLGITQLSTAQLSQQDATPPLHLCSWHPRGPGLVVVVRIQCVICPLPELLSQAVELLQVWVLKLASTKFLCNSTGTGDASMCCSITVTLSRLCMQ